MCFNRKNKTGLSRKEIADAVQHEDLHGGCGKVVNVLFSADKTRRCVITEKDKGYLSYSFEKLEEYDEDELRFFPKGTSPYYWVPVSCAQNHVFDDMDILMRELKADHEYKLCFDDFSSK